MYCSLSFLVVLGLIGVFLEVKGFAGYNLFETDNLDGSAASFPDLGSDNIAWDDPIEEPEPDKNIPFDTSPPLTGDDTNPDSIVADCATDRLGARDETIICPTNDFKSPELPTLGGVTDKFIPPDEQDNPLREMSPLISPVLAGDDSNCPPGKYFRLCCICDGFFDFSFCQDCLQSKPPFRSCPYSYYRQSLR